MECEDSIKELESRIGYVFKQKKLFKQALTHSSYANERKINNLYDYERLEFLGDAVLELVASIFLFEKYPGMPEGNMSKKRATLVCEPSLAFCAKDIGIGAYLLLGKGEETTGGRNRDSIIADVMEAIIGAIYLDGGFDQAKAFIHRYILSDLENKQLFYDSKTILQERIQKNNDGMLCYELMEVSGPDHDKQFITEVKINGRVLGKGCGRTKKAAEQQAAYEALLIYGE